MVLSSFVFINRIQNAHEMKYYDIHKSFLSIGVLNFQEYTR